MKRTTILIKVFAVVSVLAMLASGCSTGAPTAAPASTPAATVAPTPAPTEASAATTAPADTSAPPAGKTYDKHIKFTKDAIDAEKFGLLPDGSPDPVWEWFAKKFNVEFEMVPVGWGDYYQEKPLLWMASNSQPDIIMIDIAPPRYPMFLDWVNNGKLKPYASFDGYPNLQAKWDAGLGGKKFAVDGKVYAFPSFIDTGKYNFIADKCYTYRKDWADKVGMRQPNDEYTWDQWIAMIKAVRTAKLGGDDTIGIIGDDWTIPRCLEGVRAICPSLEQYTKVNGQWIWGPMQDSALEAVKYTKQLYDEGVIWTDEPIVKSGEDPANKFIAGKAFAIAQNNMNIGGWYQDTGKKFESANPGVTAESAVGWAMVKAPDGKFLVEKTSDHWTETALGPQLTDEQMTRWMDMLDYMVSEEGYYMRNAGVPGEDWNMTGDQLNLLWSKDDKGNLVSRSDGSGTWQVFLSGGCNDAFNLINPNNPQWARDAVRHVFERVQESDVTVLPFDVDLNYFNATNYNTVGNMERDIYLEILSLLPKPADSIEASWKAWVQSQMVKIQPVLDELNKANIN